MKDNAYFCPNCGSPAVDRSSLAGGDATCGSCGWKGKTDDVQEVPFDTGFASTELVMQRFAAEITGIVAKHLAQPAGAFLLKWGFIASEDLAAELGIYLKQMAIAATMSIIETRKGIATGTIKRPAVRKEQS